MSKSLKAIKKRIERAETRRDLNGLRAVASMFFLAVMAVMPVYVTQSKYTGIIRYKTEFFMTATAVCAALAAVFLISCGFRLRDYYVEDEPKHRVSAPEWAAMAFAVMALLSTALSSWQSVVWAAKGPVRRLLGFPVLRGGVSVIPENPLLGTGPDTYYYALGEGLQQEAVSRYGVMFGKAHNTYIQIAVCLGVSALIAFLTTIGGLFVPAGKAAFNRPVLLAFGAVSLSYLIQRFFEMDMPIDKPMLWVSLA